MGEAARKKRLGQDRAHAIEAAKTPDGMAVERERYAAAWSEVDAAAFTKGGHYAWMASRVDGHERVLEIGTGDGSSTLALLRAGHVVVGVDENPACLRRARDRIEAAGIPVEATFRGAVRPDRDGYAITYQPVTVPPPERGLLLVEGDTLNDPALLAWLRVQPPFDAVVCWLMGGHRARQFNVAVPREDARRYRLLVQQRLYQFADAVLRPGGLLNVIDRGALATTPVWIEAIRADLVGAHRELAEGTSMRIDPRIDTRPYDSPAGQGIAMQVSPSISGVVVPNTVTGLTSVTARKPSAGGVLA